MQLISGIFNKAKGRDLYLRLFNEKTNIAQPTGPLVIHTHTYLTYYIYIITDRNRKKTEINITGDLGRRLYQLENGDVERQKPNCVYLVYWEGLHNLEQALRREKEIKKLSKKKRKALISSKNPQWEFLNNELRQVADLLTMI